MKEIIHIQVGQCGNQISDQFWETIAKEHCLDSNGEPTNIDDSYRISQRNVYFQEVSPNKFDARSVLVDLESSTISKVLSGPNSKLYNTYQSVTSKDDTGAANNWITGFYTEGPLITEEVLEAIRQEVENTESLQGFQLVHGLGGGTGSGFGSLLGTKLKEEYPNCVLSSFSVLPSPKVSDCVVEPYNAILTLSYLIENADVVFLLDNEAIFNLCRGLKLPDPTYRDLNAIIAHAMSSLTTSFRFPQQPNSDLQQLVSNMVPSPRLHFLSSAISPLRKPSGSFQSVPELVNSLFSPHNQLVACDPRNGRLLSGTCILRGQLAVKEVSPFSVTKPEWKSTHCLVPPPNYGLLTACSLSNNTAIKEVFQRIHDQFDAMFRRKAFLWGMMMGTAAMDEMEFTEAGCNVTDLISEYSEMENEATPDEKQYEKSELV